MSDLYDSRVIATVLLIVLVVLFVLFMVFGFFLLLGALALSSGVEAERKASRAGQNLVRDYAVWRGLTMEQSRAIVLSDIEAWEARNGAAPIQKHARRILSRGR